MRRVPMLLPLVGLTVGIAFGGVVPWWTLPLILGLGVLLSWRGRNIAGAVIFFCVVGAFNIQRRHQTFDFPSGEYTFSCVPTEVRTTSRGGWRIVATVDTLGSVAVRPFRAMIYLPSGDVEPDTWHRLKGVGRFESLPDNDRIPYVADHDIRLKNMGVVAHVILNGGQLSMTAPQHSLGAWTRETNHRLQARLARCQLTYAAYSVIDAMLLGNASELDVERRHVYSSAGLSHILALSGTHVAIISTLVVVLLWPLYFGRHIRLLLVVTVMFLWTYALVTGLSPSVVRAVVMVTIAALLRMFQLRKSPLNTLFLAAFLILIVQPDDLFAIGFQLSFLAVLGIIIFYPLLNPSDFGRHNPWLHRLWSYPALSISAVLLTSLGSIGHFHSFPVWFLLSNILVVPLVPLVMVCGIILLISPHLAAVAAVANRVASILDGIADMVSALPLSVVDSIYLPQWAIIVVIALMVSIGWCLRNGKAYLSSCFGLILATVFIVSAISPRSANVEMYRHQALGHENVILRDGGRLYLATDAKEASARSHLFAYYEELLRHYMTHRGVTSFELLPAGVTVERQTAEDALGQLERQ